MDAYEGINKPAPRRGPSLLAVTLLAIVFGVIAGFGGTFLALSAVQHGHFTFLLGENQSDPTLASASALPSVNRSGGGSFVPVADRLDESVVNINTVSQQENPLPFFLGGGSQTVKGLGTGVIVDTSGFILTNFHVVDNAKDITVTVMHKGGKRRYKATFIGGDKQEDLALIKINASGLRPVAFGNSDVLRQGEPVMAIGNPFGFEHTVSVGVVSALNRPVTVDETVTLRNMIQTDASINPGNSGGPLVDLNGQVVGINSAVFVGQGNGEPQARGIGFAIPSNRVVNVMKFLRKGGKVPHPFIGISYADIASLSQEERTQLHLPMKDGALITRVLPDGPAAKAGIAVNDVIVAANGKPLQEKSDLDNAIKSGEVGSTITLTVKTWNDAGGNWNQKVLRVTIGNMPANFSQRMRMNEPGQEQAPGPEAQPQIPTPWGF